MSACGAMAAGRQKEWTSDYPETGDHYLIGCPMAAEIEDVLRVRRASSATKLASAISHKLYDGESVVLKYIGAAACNQAVKAVIIAQRHVAEERGWILSMRGEFVDVEMPDRPVTGILLRILVEK